MGFFKIARSREEASNYPTQLVKSAVKIDAAERGPLSYIAGYIVSKMHQKSIKKKGHMQRRTTDTGALKRKCK